MKSEMDTYASSGVDSKEEIKGINSLVKRLTNKKYGRIIGEPLSKIGHYAGLLDFGSYFLAITTDGVGSKIVIANKMKKWNTIGIDCIAMCVNDLLAMNIEPIAFSDYIAIERPNEEIMDQIGEGLQKGAEESRINISSGETATLPEIVKGFDIAGTCIGIVNKDRVITGEHIKIGDAILGIPSNGVHSNGYSLVRKVIKKAGYFYSEPIPYLPYNSDWTIGDELLKPTKIYIEILDLTKECEIHGMAHITGKGAYEKLRRITKYGMAITNPIDVLPIFEFLQEIGHISSLEMYKTFNMGMGFLIILPKNQVVKAKKVITNIKEIGYIINEPKCNIKVGSNMLNVWTW